MLTASIMYTQISRYQHASVVWPSRMLKQTLRLTNVCTIDIPHMPTHLCLSLYFCKFRMESADCPHKFYKESARQLKDRMPVDNLRYTPWKVIYVMHCIYLHRIRKIGETFLCLQVRVSTRIDNPNYYITKDRIRSTLPHREIFPTRMQLLLIL